MKYILTELSEIIPQLHDHSQYIKKYIKFMNYEPFIEKKGKLEIINIDKLEFKNVRFCYPNNDYVINGLSLTFNRGKK